MYAPRTTPWVVVSVFALAAAGVILAVVAATGTDLADERDDVLLPLLAFAAFAALAAWRSARAEAIRERASRRDAESQIGAREQELSDAVARAKTAEQELSARDRELATSRDEAAEAAQRAAELERAREHERDTTERLRREVIRLHQEAAHREISDVRELVLRTAIALVGAEKGLLLARTDAEGDGDLDLVCAVAFDNDPEHSAVAQHFAREVIAHDSVVREDDAHELDGERNAADEEIDNLVAIPIYIRDRFTGVVVCANKPGGFADVDDDVLLALGDHAGAVLENARLQGDLRASYLATLRMLREALAAKDPFLRGHSEDVSRYVAAVADRLGLDPRRREELVFASLLHDVGKIGISERILLKPGPLTPEERAVVELHPRIGYRVVEQVPALRPIAPAILHHHERFDGEGYPSRLVAEDIPVEARVIAVADSFAAMTSERPYRARMNVDEACEELKRCAGTQFDPDVVALFTDAVREAPPSDGAGVLAEALDDPELETRRAAGEPVLGFGAFDLVDSLTLLYRFRHFHEVARAEARRAELQGVPFAVAVVELTGLPQVNRDEGYAAGDDAIRFAATAMHRVAGRRGGTAARLSGARLAVLVRGLDADAADGLEDELAAELADARGGVRIGVAAWQAGDSGEDVVNRARLEAGAATAAR